VVIVTKLETILKIKKKMVSKLVVLLLNSF